MVKLIKLTSVDNARKYDHLYPLLIAMTEEFREAARKKPESILSKNKVVVVNRLLTDVLSILDGEEQRQYLDLFNSDDLPQNSDVSLMLGQVSAAMDTFQEMYFVFSESHHKKVWATTDNFVECEDKEVEDENSGDDIDDDTDIDNK